MDQLKVFLRQCVKYRFWIAIGIALILPMTGYLVGASALTEATTKEEAAIKSADSDVGKYTSGTQPNPEYKTLVDEKKEALAKDVDATARKLYARQEPLRKWPEVVQDRFPVWGRKWPENIDRGRIDQAVREYTQFYPDFVQQVYKTAQPWNPEDGTGIVYTPDVTSLIRPAPFSFDNQPTVGRIWSEQERLWVVTALLDVVAKVNKAAGAKDWDGAWIKQIVSTDVGSPLAQDQKSLAKGEALEPAPPIVDPAAPPAATTTAPDPTMNPMGGSGGSADAAGEVYYFKTDPTKPYKVVPVQMTVLIDQNRIPDYLVALEDSPMAIQVLDIDIAKPLTPVVKPVYQEAGYAAGGMTGSGMMGGMRGVPGYEGFEGGGMGGMNQAGRMGGMGPAPGMGPGSAMGPGGMMGGGGFGGMAKTGTNLRGVNKAQERKNREKAEKTKAVAAKKGVDQYFNIVEVTFYGQARFYNTPPAPPAPTESSTAPATPVPSAVAEPPATAPAAAPATPPAAPATPPAEAPATPPAAAPAPAPASTPAPTPETPGDKPAAPPEGATPKR